MKRKNFILLSGLGISAIAIPTWHFNFRELEYDSSLKSPEFLSNFLDGKSIIEIGELYLKQVPDENNERKLVSLLPISDTSDNNTIEILQQQITDEYISGETFIVDGWILSKTEARQCALYSLIQNQ
jgi:hypothetical protein